MKEILHIANIIDYPLKEWARHCYSVVMRLLGTGMVEGEIITGHYHYGDNVCDHCWIKMPDGRVCDPTRWQFEDKEPYIYFGPETEHYDEDSKRWDAEMDKLRDVLFGKGEREAKELRAALGLV